MVKMTPQQIMAMRREAPADEDILSDYERKFIGKSGRIDVSLKSPLYLRKYGEVLEALGKALRDLSHQHARQPFDILSDARRAMDLSRAELAEFERKSALQGNVLLLREE